GSGRRELQILVRHLIKAPALVRSATTRGRHAGGLFLFRPVLSAIGLATAPTNGLLNGNQPDPPNWQLPEPLVIRARGTLQSIQVHPWVRILHRLLRQRKNVGGHCSGRRELETLVTTASLADIARGLPRAFLFGHLLARCRRPCRTQV